IAPVPKSARLVSWAAECSTPVGCPPTPKDYTDRWYIVRGNWLPASSGYKSQMTSVDGVIRDSGERASIPPFADEHAELRETIARWVRAEIVPHVDDWERAREFPRELYRRAGELGFLGLKYPTELGGQGGHSVH